VIQTSKQTDEWRQASGAWSKASEKAAAPTECWCLHGAVGAASDWRVLAAKLAEGGLATRAVDLWRFLQCESVPMPEFAKLLNAEAAGEVARGQKRILVGYSMGGRLAMHALLDGGPWDAAVIISANPGIRDPAESSARRSTDALWATQALTLGWDDFLTKWSAQAILNGAIRDEREDKKLIQRRREIARSFVDWSVGNQTPLWDRLSSITIPVLWVAGENDTKFCAFAQEAAALAENFQIAIAPETGHRVPWERGDWLAERIREMVAKLA
jgi:2-succinyl-6-hydroxy-2,4-cyclohexadiene-1-carboxylate synthase